MNKEDEFSIDELKNILAQPSAEQYLKAIKKHFPLFDYLIALAMSNFGIKIVRPLLYPHAEHPEMWICDFVHQRGQCRFMFQVAIFYTYPRPYGPWEYLKLCILNGPDPVKKLAESDILFIAEGEHITKENMEKAISAMVNYSNEKGL